MIAVTAHSGRPLGIGIDLGTTNIAAFLVNLNTGATLAGMTTANPQSLFGGDVVTRLARACCSDTDRASQRAVVVDAINGLIDDLCANAMVEPDKVVDLVVAGNTAMHHLFAGLPIKQLVKARFVPSISQAIGIKARDLGLHAAAGALVHLPGIIAGYVGSDHSTALLASRSEMQPGLSFLVDIGTNTEISVFNKGRIISVSCPSGPALEGGSISMACRQWPVQLRRLGSPMES